jgi:hypothetical protein
MASKRPGRAARRKPTRQPWSPREDALLRKLPPAEAARRTGRTVQAVYARRFALGVSRNYRG